MSKTMATTGESDISYKEKLTRHVSERRQLLLDVAADVFSKKGLHQTTMDDVAEAVGVAKVVLYRYFGSRGGLIHAILERVVERTLEEDSKDSSWWGSAIHRTFKSARKNAGSIMLLLRHSAHDPDYGHHFKAYHAELVERTSRRLEQIWVEPRHMPVDTEFCSNAILMFIYDSLIRWLETGDPTKDKEFATWVTDSIEAWSHRWAEAPSPSSLLDRPSKQSMS